ncbi:MAG TPA: M13 family metallopeptidase [Bryobacteraceae bacterium]|jgi:endothelin-converting enzyme/putative endopeptidase|nr:M13 family metallopeptidase [Bryobacteraceae bacterium]
MISRAFASLAVAVLGSGVLPAQTGQPLNSLPYSPSLNLESMDRSADPCVDFYRYACGGWQQKNPIPPDQSSWDVYRKMADQNQQFLWGILQQAAKPDAGRGVVEREIGDYFAACMNQDAIEKAGLTPLEPRLKEIAELKTPRDLARFLAGIHMTLDDGALFRFGADQDLGDSSRVIAFASADGLGLPERDYYFRQDAKSKEIRKTYLKHLQTMLELLGDSAPRARTEAARIMEMETSLAQATLTVVERRDPNKLHHKLTRAQLAALAPNFPWDIYFDGIGLSGLRELNVTEPAFFRRAGLLVKTRGMDDWKPYLRVRIVEAAAPFLPKRFEQARFDFYSKFLRGVPEMRPRWKRCVSHVDDQLGEALGQAFVERVFRPAQKQAAVRMSKQIETAMEAEIKNLPWMSDTTKHEALLKLHNIVNKVGYPDRWRDYSSIRIDRGDFLGNGTRAGAFEFRRELNKIGKPVDRGEWAVSPPTVDAYYNPQMNDINFPAGVLQPPLFDMKMDDAPNYGNTGSTIGHELTHGFDDEGRHFDARGNLRDWWTPQDSEAFEKRAKCVSDQYAQYTVVDDVKINSKLTLGEDIADLGGTLLGYIAWKHATEGQDLKPVDGLTPDQRFFVGMAQWACGNDRPEVKRERAMTDPHSPLEYRVNGVVSNLPQFAAAFACKAGQPMVRANACRVW